MITTFDHAIVIYVSFDTITITTIAVATTAAAAIAITNLTSRTSI